MIVKWTKKEIEFLIKYYPCNGKLFCSNKLKKSESSIRWKASILGLRQNRKSDFFKEWQNRARISKIGKKRPEHSITMKRLSKEGRLPQLTIKSERIRNIISQKAIKRIKEKGHPRGMLGKKQTEYNKKAVSISSKKMWSDKNHIINSKKHRQMLSDKAMNQTNFRTNKNCYSRCKQGKYNINGKIIFFRSSWEANYALYLDFLIKQGKIIKWEYEVDTFWFEKIRRGVRSYKPDFKVTYLNKSIQYHEVKGYMDAKSKTKIKRMAKYYPEITLLVIDQKFYKDIKNKIGKLLRFY